MVGLEVGAFLGLGLSMLTAVNASAWRNLRLTTKRPLTTSQNVSE